MLGQSRFGLFYQVSATYGIGDWLDKRQSTTNGITNEIIYKGKSWEIQANINPGLTYFATKRIGIEATFGNIGYRLEKNNNNRESGFQSEMTTQQLNANFSLSSLSLGVRVYLGKNKNP